MDPEQQPLLNNAEAAPAAERPGLSMRSWIFVACGVVAVVSGVALVSTMPNDRAPAVIAKRLNLAKTRAVKYTSLSKTEQLSLFDEFKTTYGRSYKDDQEEDSKFAAFQAFLQMADDRNAAEAAAGLPEPAVHGLTQFADMTAEEFASMYLTGLKMPKMGVNDAAVDEKPVLTFDDVLKYRTKEAKAGKEAEKSLEEVDPLLETLPKDMQKALKKGAEAVKQAKLQGKEAKEAAAKAGLPPLEEMMAKYDAAASKGKGPEHARALAEHTSKKQAGKQEDGVNGGVTCKSTCYGYTCDDWGNWGYTCNQMTKYYGCDCTGCYCTAGQPTAAPTGSNKCAATCMGYTCDALGKYGYTCATLQKTYGCDCSGCSCSAGQPTPAPTGSGKCTSNCFGNYNCDQYANTWYVYSLRLGSAAGRLSAPSSPCLILSPFPSPVHHSAQLTGWGCDCTGCQCTYGMPTVAPTNYPTSTGAKDWTGIYTTPVEDQGACGSCWTFSATAQMESDSIRLGLLPLASTSSLSKQELVSCDTTCNGCNGGLPSIAYNWVQANGGIYAPVSPHALLQFTPQFLSLYNAQASPPQPTTRTPTPLTRTGRPTSACSRPPTRTRSPCRRGRTRRRRLPCKTTCAPLAPCRWGSQQTSCRRTSPV